MGSDHTRRDFLGATSGSLGAAWLGLQLPAIQAAVLRAEVARRENLPLEVLTDEEAAELEAIAERIFPADDTAGAAEIGVVHYMDQALGSFQAASLEPIREGLAELEASVRDAHPGVSRFSELSGADQDAVLREIQDGGFFGLVRGMTISGLFGHPRYGGNRDRSGWRHLGFDDRPTWEPPFGYYDAEAAADGGDR